MDGFKAHTKFGGPGGWQCKCCGPKSKDRPAARRQARARLAAETRRIANGED